MLLDWSSFVKDIDSVITTFITARNKVGQGNIFTGVYDSVNRGVSGPEGGVWCLLGGGA